jgi:hypothetical protein
METLPLSSPSPTIPKEVLPILVVAIVIHGILMTSGFTFFGLLIYGLFTAGLTFISILFNSKKNVLTPITSLSISSGILVCIILITELIRHFGSTRDIQNKPSVKYVNIIIWVMTGLFIVTCIGIVIFIINFPDIISFPKQVKISDTMMYLLVVFILFYGSIVTSIR